MQISECTQWQLVRYIPPDFNGYDPSTDMLNGDEEFGAESD